MSITTRIFIFVLISVWVAGFFMEFLIPYSEGLTYLYPFTKTLYSTVCHQQPEKLLVFNHHHTLVCSRCTGIYLGGFISSFIFLFVKKINIKSSRIILLSAIPMVADVIFYSVGFYNYSKTIALTSGLLFGSVGIVYIYNGFQILLEKND